MHSLIGFAKYLASPKKNSKIWLPLLKSKETPHLVLVLRIVISILNRLDNLQGEDASAYVNTNSRANNPM